MLRLTRFEELAAIDSPLHLALGVFDGVHLGHRAVISRALEAAEREGGTAGVVTFDPHPIRVLAPDKAPRALLATLDHKAHLLAELGVKLLFAIHFDEAFATLEAEAFLDRLLMAPVRTISIGEDWKFGHARRGDVPMLRRFSAERGFRLEAVPPVMGDGERISSTRIRQAIRDGNLDAAATMLGRPYSVEGQVMEGRKLGRQLGFPTANVATGEVQLPPDGVWAVRAALDDEKLEGVANLGVRPTVDGVQHALEVHLFDFVGDLYDRTLEVTFLSHLRNEQKFGSLDALKNQIALDAEAARKILAEAP
ncbi:bifunctional riboflavin kinase/FAD synthetase [Luteolibacter sp. LG18]|uniref:bifunctional riboflavin kinase/FAD synthetase n=1 Tax=Luteolibacter sp. LG18 TaxID=2819286 RepID=UPI002B2BF0FF|nr:riboflavin biosynthesis protein [Luteolibacter sp. LG18]